MLKFAYKLKEIILLFLKLGLIAFGGPAAHIAMMENEVVHKRKWMSGEHFLDLVGVTNLIPGPNSTEMAIHCGFHRGSWLGLILAGVSFILPASLLTGILAWFYVRYQTLPELNHFLIGVKPAVIAIILVALFRLGRKALKNWQLGTIGVAIASLSLAGKNEVMVLLLGGVVGTIWLSYLRYRNSSIKSFNPFFLLATLVTNIEAVNTLATSASLEARATLAKLFLIFFKIGTVLFGSGYVLIAYLDGELVNSLGWLTKANLLDAVAVGQLTPGPVLSTATFIGYQLKGFWGAVIATAGIFLPSFLLVALLNPIIPKLRKSLLASTFLDAVNISAVGLMLAVTIKLSKASLTDWQAITIFLISALVLFGTKGKVNALWIVLVSGATGYLLSLI